MSKTKWYTSPIYVLLALALVLSLGIVVLPMAGTVEANPGEWYVVSGGAGNQTGESWDNAFASIQAAIDAASPGNTINVAAGTYNERLTINKPLDLRGAQYGVDPTPDGARTTPADESTVDLPVSGPLIEIANGVLGVTIDGFTLIGDPTNLIADTSVIRCGGSAGTANDITISNNVIDGKYGVIYKGGDTLTVHQNRMVVNKVGVTLQPNPATNVTISDNVITLGSNPVGDEQGIYMTGCSQSSVTGNTATGFVHNAALAGSNLDNLTVSGNTFTGNAAGISIWGNSTFITVSDNVLSNSLISSWNDSGCGISIKGQDLVIAGNEIRNNADIGVKIDHHVINTERVTISRNNISGNTNYGVWVNTTKVTDTVDATNNYWGHVSGPGGVGPGSGDTVSDGVDYSPWWGDNYVGDPHTSPWTWGTDDSIQDAVDAALAGDTINVAAGTYDEQVVIDMSLTLQGAGDNTIIKPSQTTADTFQVFSRYTDTNKNIAPIVVANGSASTSVTIKDLKVDGSGVSSVPATAYRSTSILYRNCSGKIDSVTVVGIDILGNGTGIWLGAWEHLATVEVTGCTVSGYNWSGIVADQSTSTVNIHDNTVTGKGLTDTQTQNGIQVANGATGTIRGNTISDNSYSMEVATHWDGCGILLGWTANITVEGNTIHGCDDAVLLMDTDNSTVRNNELTNNVFAGVAFEDGADYNIITENQLLNNKAGILVCGPGCPEAEWGYQANHSGLVGVNNEAHLNNIVGNTSYGVFSPDVEFDATNNWWGDASGPTHASNTFNAGSQGDAVSDNVDFVPWLDAAYDMGTSFAPVENADTNEQFSSIQAAIDDAYTDAGNTINVAAGIYNETVKVNKELTLQGEGRDVVTVTAADDYVFNVTAHNVTISGFNITGAKEHGICLDKRRHCEILHNIITANGDDGIYLDTSPGNTISGNEITANGDDGIYLNPTSGATISGNEITANVGDGIYLDSSSDNTISGNEITANVGHGIYIDKSSGNTISDNEITDNVGGINLDSSNNNDISKNDILNNSASDGIHLASASSNNTIQSNNIVGNSPYGVHNKAVEMVDAKNNWWGDASGPGGVGLGTGDAVSDNVTYSPWFNAPYPDGEPISFTGSTQEPTSSGDYTVDARDKADTKVIKKGDGTPTVTVAKYSANPGSGFTGDVGKYIDVHIDDTTGVDELIIKVYYTDAEVAGLDESSLRLRWWDGDSWELCSDSGVDTAANYMWARVRADTTPSLSQLTGTPFAGRGTSAPVEVADVGPELIYLRVDFLGEISKMRLGDNNRLRDTLIALSPDGRLSLEIEEGTLAPLVDGKRIYLIEIREAEECPPLPEDTIVAGKVYDLTPSGATFDKDVILILGFNPMELPENTVSVTMAYYVSDEGWVDLESEPGGVAELGTMTAAVNHFTPFAILAKLAPPAPPPVPAPPPTLPAAHFVASGLTIEPSVRGIWEPITFVTRTGESVTISANVANDGGQEGIYIVELKINGETVDSKEVTLAAGQSQRVSFTLSGMDYGRYEVEVAGLSGEFAASRIINWWLIIGIIAAIGLITWGVIRGRRRVYS